MVAAPFLNYEPALRAKPAPKTTFLARLHEPYFERTVGHYFSHQNTPFKLTSAAHPAALQNGRVIWLAHPVGALYFHHGVRLHRQLFLNALDRIYQHPVLETRLMSAGRAVLTHKADQRRFVAHLLYASPQQRGRCTVIEDLPTLIDVPVALRVPQKIIQVDLPVHGTTLTMSRRARVVRVTVPRVHCHEVVVFNY